MSRHTPLEVYSGGMDTSSLPLLFEGAETPARVGLAVADFPQARYLAAGPENLSDCELLAMLLQGTHSAENAVELARKLVFEAGSLRGLARWTHHEYAAHGIAQLKAAQLAVLPEIARRLLAQGCTDQPILKTPEQIYAHLYPLSVSLDVEKFWVVCLNRKNRLIKLTAVTSGTATAALVHPREVFREALRQSATAIVCAHNHPSGDPSPSAADLHLTRQLREAARAVDIELLDHVVIGRAPADPMGLGYYSFRAAGLL